MGPIVGGNLLILHRRAVAYGSYILFVSLAGLLVLAVLVFALLLYPLFGHIMAERSTLTNASANANASADADAGGTAEP